jgi:UDPglucose 6-dehydrogenase
MGMDRRIGHDFLKAGPGYGGSCFPKDTRALLYQGISNDVEMRVVDAVIKSNEYHRRKASDIVSELIGHIGHENIGTIGVIGAAFKPGTGDLRESPAVDLLRYLVNLGKEILVFDENVSEEELSLAVPCDHPEHLIMCPLEDLKECDFVVIMNPVDIVWPEFESHHIRVVVDMRSSVPDFVIKDLEDQGVIYIGHGRGDI